MTRHTRFLIAGVLVLVIAVLAGLYIFSRSIPLVSDQPPGRIETAIARRLVVLSIPSSVRSQSNPNPQGGNAWRDGSEQFQEHCAFCHGRDGRGHSEVANKMYPPVPDLADSAIQKMSDGSLFAIIQNGVRWTGMPGFRSEQTPEETWKLVSFIRQVPRLTPQDLQKLGGAEERERHEKMEGATVAMDGTAFSPPEMTVAVGETVTWINKDPFPHNVTSSAGHFHSPDLQPGQQWKFTPTREGQFPYVCTLHPGMNGTLIVHNKLK